MKLLLDRVGFANAQAMMDGHNPFLCLCESGEPSVEGLTLLLQRGATVHDRNSKGSTCLHLCISQFRSYVKNRLAIRDSLIYLIRQGADIRAKDFQNRSVSDVAYQRGEGENLCVSRIREDFWDCVLANCGYDISDFRRHPRRAIYIKRSCYILSYTRSHFKKLWAGCEHRCPYYHHDDDSIHVFTRFGDTGDDNDEDCRSSAEESDEDDWGGSEDGGAAL